MSGFSADWLALREPADSAARSAALIGAAGAWLSELSEPLVCDLGAGTGASVRAFAPVFPQTARWLLVDADPVTLALAEGPGVATRVVDLVAAPAPWPGDCALVTATALFDLAAPGWIDRFVAALAHDRLPILSCLTYDGRVAMDPVHPRDADMIAAFNAHQRTDKGLGGPAAGPDAHGHLVAALEAHGYAVAQAETPWHLCADDHGALIAAVLDGWADAAQTLGTLPDEAVRDWRAARLANTARLVIGHRDLFATPRMAS